MFEQPKLLTRHREVGLFHIAMIVMTIALLLVGGLQGFALSQENTLTPISGKQ